MSKKKNALLWKIESDYQDSFLSFGTMHVRDRRAFRYHDLAQKKIQECNVYAAEMNLDEVNQAAMADMMDLDQDLLLSTLA